MNSSDVHGVIDMHVTGQLLAHKRKGQSAFERLLPIFMEESRMLVAQMRCAIAASDAEGLRLTAHKLKGSASVLGSVDVRVLSQTIVDNAVQGVMPQADTLQQIERAIDVFHDAAQAIITR